MLERFEYQRVRSCSALCAGRLVEGDKLLVVVLPPYAVSEFMDTIVYALARRGIEAVGIVAHNAVICWTPHATPIGITALKESQTLIFVSCVSQEVRPEAYLGVVV